MTEIAITETEITTSPVTLSLMGNGRVENVELLVDYDELVAAIEARGFVYSTSEEDDDLVTHTYQLGAAFIDVTVWDVIPDGFAPIGLGQLALPA